MIQKIIALVGISGVGKTTFLKQVATSCMFQHLTAGSLIAQARSVGSATRDSLRLSDLSENQNLLIQGFADARDPAARVVIMDGHVIIHSAEGLIPIDSQVFSSLGIDIIAHLEADPAQVYSNRIHDVSRLRPFLSIDEIREHQSYSISEAKRIADDLGIPLKRLTYVDAEMFGQFMSDAG